MSLDLFPRIASALSPFGLKPLGQCHTERSDDLPFDGTLILVGPDEPTFWPIFTQSPEYADAAPDPLDRWSRRVLSNLALQFDGKALFPFGGPPFQPIFTWALRTGQLWSSPIGFLVHDQAGLFVSFRGVLLVRDHVPATPTISPCDRCADQPCKTTCPVGAFDSGYDVALCKTHLSNTAGADCMTQGCRARRACPIGQSSRLPEQAQHHMKAFL
jgi:hypothetical protein